MDAPCALASTWAVGDLSPPIRCWQAVSLCNRRGWYNTSDYSLTLISLTQQPDLLCWFQNSTISRECSSFFFWSASPRPEWMQPPSTSALKEHAAEPCRLKCWCWLHQAPPQEALADRTCSLRDHDASNPKPEGSRDKMVSRESCRCFGASWFLEMVLLIVSQRRSLKPDCPPHTRQGTETAPRDSQAPEHFCSLVLVFRSPLTHVGSAGSQLRYHLGAQQQQCGHHWARQGARRTRRFVENFLWWSSSIRSLLPLGHAWRNAFSLL